jgi:hypothetical protein
MPYLPPVPANLAAWLGRAQERAGTAPPAAVLDQLVIGPLLCQLEDDLHGIGLIMSSVNFNPEPPTYALR